jgi:hypothetical protein
MSAAATDIADRTQVGWVLPAEAVRSIVDGLSRRAVPFALLGVLSSLPGGGATVIPGPEGVLLAADQSGTLTFHLSTARHRPINQLGWSGEQAAVLRHKLAAFAQDWDDPAMDAYDAL